jgi:hypothetical protein
MDYKKQEEFTRLHIQMRQATDSLHTQATEVYGMAKKLEELTEDTTIRYAGLVQGWRRGRHGSKRQIFAECWRRWVSR